MIFITIFLSFGPISPQNSSAFSSQSYLKKKHLHVEVFFTA